MVVLGNVVDILGYETLCGFILNFYVNDLQIPFSAHPSWEN